MIKLLLIVFFVLIIFDLQSNNSNNIGTVKVIDGDTIYHGGIKIRFSGIDAPESNFRGRNQNCLYNQKIVNCGDMSKDFLIQLIKNKKVTCKLEKKLDQFNRKLGECFINNESLSKILVKNGYAFDYPKYSKFKFSKYQKYAKKKELGLWKMKFQFPWDFRDKVRKN